MKGYVKEESFQSFQVMNEVEIEGCTYLDIVELDENKITEINA